jgi:hypothetical protein
MFQTEVKMHSDVLKSVRFHEYLHKFTKLLALKWIYFIFLTYICWCITLSIVQKIVEIVLNGSYLLEYSVAW